MKKLFFVFLVLILIDQASAQKAVPDFSVTDIYGHSHKLYTDYLDNNKFVFIDFYYIGCGSCQTISPVIDTVFKDFGCNYGDIVFLGINRGAIDEDVWDFSREFGMTFPSIGGIEGGGNQVHDDYEILYAPYKIIISPEKKIVSDNPDISTSTLLRDSLLNMGFTLQLCSGNDFLFYSVNSENDSIAADIDYENKRIDILMPYGTDLTDIRPTFVNAVNSIIHVNDEPQISGMTIVDFSLGPVVYRITSENGISQDWTVSLNLSENINFLENHVKIYPNPSSGYFFIENGNNGNKINHIQIFDISGKLIDEKKIYFNLDYIEIEELNSGFYFLKIFAAHGIISKKILLL